MPLVPGVHAIGPADGELLVLTYREGVAQKVGHDLVLEATAWTAIVEVGADGVPFSLAFDADARALHVRRGLHGAKPLTDSDRASIRDNIAGKVLGPPAIAFRSSGIDPAGGELRVAGELTLAGRSRPTEFVVALDTGGQVTGTLVVRQSEWGITPYRALMGALRVRDDVDVTIDVALPTA